MQVFNAFMKIAWKRKATVFVYAAVFIAIMIILTFTAKKNIQDNFSAQSLTICIEDKDESTASEGLITYLSEIHNVSQEKMDASELADQIYYRQISYVLEIPKGFEDALIRGETQDILTDVKIPGSNSGHYVDAQIREYLQCLQMHLAGGFDVAEAVEKTNSAIDAVPEVKMVSFSDNSSTGSDLLFYYYQYMAYVFILLAMTGLSPILIKLNEKEMKARMNCSSYHFSKQIRDIVSGCVCFSVIIWAVFMIISFFIFGTAIFETNVFYASLNSFVYMIFAMGVAIILSTFHIEDNVINMIGNITALASSFLCGVFVPQSILSDSVLRVGKFLPAYWYIRNNNMLAGFGNQLFDSHAYWMNLGIMGLFILVILIVAVGLAKKRHMNL